MQAGRIKSREPHVAHDAQLERIVGLPHATSQPRPLVLGRVVLNENFLIRGRGRHDDLHCPFLLVLIVPIGANPDDLLVQLSGDAAAHGHNHRLALEHLLSGFKVLHDILCHIAQTTLTAHERLELCPFGLGLLRIGQLLPCQLIVELLHHLLPLLRKGNLGEPTFVVDAHRRPVFHSLGDIVDVHVITKDRGRVDVVVLNGRPREAEICRIGQGVAEVLGKTKLDLGAHDLTILVLGLHRLGLEAVLGAVRFVGHHHYIAALRQGVVHMPLFWRELLNRGEHHTPRSHGQQ